MSVDCKTVEWDGAVLAGWIIKDGAPAKVCFPREAIHRYAAGFNDAVNWEIDRHRVEIFEKLTRLEPLPAEWIVRP